MAINSFWNDARNVEPKRQYRWVCDLAAENLARWMIKGVDKPVATVSSVQHKFHGYTYNYPGTVTWNDINVTLVDPASPSAVHALAKMLRIAGYNPPKSAATPIETISKKKSSIDAVKSITIRQVDAEGAPLEEWKLVNPIITSADFGGNLSYENEALIEVKLGLKYDWAYLTATGGDAEYWKE